MGEVEKRIHEHAAGRQFVVSTQEVFDLGGTESFIAHQLSAGRWLRLHAGVFQVDRRPPTRFSQLMAAVLACGPTARVSHRAAIVLWRMEGISTAPIEVTMDFGSLAVPDGVVVHRSRRATPVRHVEGIPVSGPERTILEACRFLGTLLVGKAVDSAIRHELTTSERIELMLANEGGRGVHGTRRLRTVLANRSHDTATDSGSEFELLYHMQRALLPRPELGFELYPSSGRRVPDFFWPALNKAVEVDGLDAHSSADRLDDDLVRQNDLMDLGIELRRFSARRVRREPRLVVEEIRRFLSA